MIAHLTGPWETQKVPTGWLIGRGEMKGPDYVADVHLHVGTAQDDLRDEANANLIAAAPCLLAAAKEFMDQTTTANRAALRKAIAQAEGE